MNAAAMMSTQYNKNGTTCCNLIRTNSQPRPYKGVIDETSTAFRHHNHYSSCPRKVEEIGKDPYSPQCDSCPYRHEGSVSTDNNGFVNVDIANAKEVLQMGNVMITDMLPVNDRRALPQCLHYIDAFGYQQEGSMNVRSVKRTTSVGHEGEAYRYPKSQKNIRHRCSESGSFHKRFSNDTPKSLAPKDLKLIYSNALQFGNGVEESAFSLDPSSNKPQHSIKVLNSALHGRGYSRTSSNHSEQVRDKNNFCKVIVKTGIVPDERSFFSNSIDGHQENYTHSKNIDHIAQFYHDSHKFCRDIHFPNHQDIQHYNTNELMKEQMGRPQHDHETLTLCPKVNCSHPSTMHKCQSHPASLETMSSLQHMSRPHKMHQEQISKHVSSTNDDDIRRSQSNSQVNTSSDDNTTNGRQLKKHVIFLLVLSAVITLAVLLVVMAVTKVIPLDDLPISL